MNSFLILTTLCGAGDGHEDDQHVQLQSEEHVPLHHPDEARLQADLLERVQVRKMRIYGVKVFVRIKVLGDPPPTNLLCFKQHILG